MKKTTGLFGVMAIVAVIGFFMSACEVENDIFEGTWIRQENNKDVQKIVAAKGSWSSYEYINNKWIEDMRGIYTVTGEEVTLVFVEVNISVLIWDGQGSEPAAQWTSYPELPDEIKEYIPSSRKITVVGDKFTFGEGDNSVIFTKQQV